MEKTVKEHLHGKTILMATHAIKFAKLADYIILMKDGRVEACSTYDEARSNPYFSEIEERMEEQQHLHKCQLKKNLENEIIK